LHWFLVDIRTTLATLYLIEGLEPVVGQIPC